MSIVIITIPDARKQSFVADVQKATAGAVALVVVQQRPPRTWPERIRDWQNRGLKALLEDVYYGLRLRLSPAARQRLACFQAVSTKTPAAPGWSAPTLFVADVNDPAVLDAIKQIAPSVLAVWGSGMLHDTLITAAPVAFNVHLGISTHYRGAYANQRAVERDDWAHIGATIHHIERRADAGAVVATVPARLQAEAAETFAELHDRVEETFVDIITRVHAGETVSAQPVDISRSENLRLRDWTPRRRYQLACKLKTWCVATDTARQLAKV